MLIQLKNVLLREKSFGLVEAIPAMGDPQKIPAESTEEAAILTTNGNIALLHLTGEEAIPLKSRLANKVKGLYEYAGTMEGQAMMAVIVFAITVLIVLFILIRSWKRKRRLENMDQKQGTDMTGKSGQSLTRLRRNSKKK
ncbi:FeoB-associated Cys-rich membrane protein [Brevibacillus laterosporus]|uniref:FeoB-associated Cys-rich membrane protein n=1 Tax=Brevibacillus laterosporus TaxID=1465 RepID=UPI002651BCE2|nr:FeoB-associated Cys-rich membrane protein [Brevibacillus laterosporus]MDN9010620.1 FeoB-associated Cys-rich membrane protein [Brevibacillus laterosporus]MDO0941471.1 FeoB-associated Cys-rich membrane protein [Brevibacillus laterosporus]